MAADCSRYRFVDLGKNGLVKVGDATQLVAGTRPNGH